MFQDVLIICLPWAKLMFDEKGQLHQARCMVCTFVERKEKLLAPKLDNLLKHQGCCKAKVFMPMVDASNFTPTKILYMQKMSDVTQLPTNVNMSNLLLFSISLPTNVSCLIMKA